MFPIGVLSIDIRRYVERGKRVTIEELADVLKRPMDEVRSEIEVLSEKDEIRFYDGWVYPNFSPSAFEK